ncbi:MAG: O-antigen ligase family protein [Leptolyngbyaceae bacterium]|nr:O-antigen ligase family protein [Leptolyngbyaceae bacterium]
MNPLSYPLLLLQKHPDPNLRSHWNWVQAGVLILPFSPLLAAISFLVTALVICQRQFNRLCRQPLNWGFAILSMGLILTALVSIDPSASLLGLFNFIPLFLVIVALSTLLQTTAQLRQAAWLLVLGAIPVVVMGLGQLFWGWSRSTSVLSIVLDGQIAPGGSPVGRMASIFGYATFLASYLTMVFPLAIALWLESILEIRRQKPDLLAGWKTGFLSLAVVGIAIALLLTDSRNAWAIGALVCLAFALYQSWYWLVGLVGVITSTIAGASFGPPPLKTWLRVIVPAFLWERLSDEKLAASRPIAELRRTQWEFAWSLTQQRPWTGWGLRSFSTLYEAKMDFWVGHPHNLLLMFTSETGIPATLLLVGLVGWVVFQGVLGLLRWSTTKRFQGGWEWQQDKLIFFSYLVAFMGCTLFSLLDIPLFDFRSNFLGWFLLAGIYGVSCKLPNANR